MSGTKTICILVVDDHADTLRAMARLLKVKGYGVIAANNAEEAEALAAKNHCDLLISDIELPGRSGEQLIRTLRAVGPMKAIAVTGHVSAQDHERAMRAGFDRFVPKPVVFAELVNAIEALVGAAEVKS